MEAQEYFDKLLEEVKIFSKKSNETKQEYIDLFPESLKTEEEVSKYILEMDDESLRKYFNSSQILLDTQTMFLKVASFADFCKNLNIEVDISNIFEVPGLSEFVTMREQFDTEFIVKEDKIIEKNSSRMTEKFKIFKQSLGTAIKLNM